MSTEGFMLGSKHLQAVRAALGPIWPFCLAVIFDFAAALCMWFYVLVRGAYDYVNDRNFFTQHSSQFDYSAAHSHNSAESIEMVSSSNSSTPEQQA